MTSFDFHARAGFLAAVIASTLSQLVAQPAPAVTYRVISYMQQYNQPFGMTEESPGVFYTAVGSPNPVVFTITSQGVKKAITSFPSEHFIDGLMVSGADGRLYNSAAPNYAVFSVGGTPGKQVYPAQPIIPILTQNLPDGRLLGTGGSNADAVYLVTSDLQGTVTPIYAFPAADRLPVDAILASDGNYYGVYYLQDGTGSVYRITPSGSLTTLHNFNPSFVGYAAWVPLLQAGDGNLYGVTPNGGENGTGSIYKLTLGGQYTLLYQFPKGANYSPSALIEASDGNLYGATTGFGGQSLLFRATKSGEYTLLHAMIPYNDGQCQCQLTQGSDGIIYGSATAGGINGAGAYFALDAGLPKPSPRTQHFNPQSGSVGTQVLIWGFNLLSASVEFNGVPAAAVKNSGANYVLATVPVGAASGPITVTTPGGTVTTNASFTVQ